MSTTKKLSRDRTPLSKLLKDWGKGAEYATEAAAMDEYSALARALEERVAMTEAYVKEQQENIGAAFQAGLAPLTTRAETAEAQAKVWMQLIDNDRLRAESAEAEVVRLKRDLGDANAIVGKLVQKGSHLQVEREAAEAQLEYVRNTVRVQEETAQELEAEIARLREEIAGHDRGVGRRGLIPITLAQQTIEAVEAERDALRAKMAAVREECDGYLFERESIDLRRGILEIIDRKGEP